MKMAAPARPGELSKLLNQTDQTKPSLPNQTYQSKPSLPNRSYQTKSNLAYQAYWTKPIKPKLLVKAVNAWVRSAFGNVLQLQLPVDVSEKMK